MCCSAQTLRSTACLCTVMQRLSAVTRTDSRGRLPGVMFTRRQCCIHGPRRDNLGICTRAAKRFRQCALRDRKRGPQISSGFEPAPDAKSSRAAGHSSAEARHHNKRPRLEDFWSLVHCFANILGQPEPKTATSLRGLNHLGNTCYGKALLIGLSRLPLVRGWFSCNAHAMDGDPNHKPRSCIT